MAAFRVEQKVLFKHCDPAGIVFFPRYCEMLNDAVEAFFDRALSWPFEAIHPGRAVPTVSLDLRFKSPSRHGDLLVIELAVAHVGRSALRLWTTARAEQLRFTADQTLVLVGADARPEPWPDAFRERARALQEPRA